jgi:Fe-S-cluster-containing dehydrogenase component/DMSO reductase anchor subunit
MLFANCAMWRMNFLRAASFAMQLETANLMEFPTPSPPPPVDSLLQILLRGQQQLSAVEVFAREHDRLATHEESPPAQARHYRALLPATEPGPGQQYAFDVDLDRCSGCKACVAACHTLNGLDEHETWRDVGLMIGGTRSLPVLQHVTTACHHCLEPACMEACPVNAYEKDPKTGIVKHLDDQCFGCQYCTLACPYDVPKYHAGLGIVRKCDMCSTRLAVGEAPACVQACPHEAIRIQIVDVAHVAEEAEAGVFLPAAPDPQITLPTTTFRSRRMFPRNLLPADYLSLHAQHPHWPLILLLVLTQLSVGAFVVSLLLREVLSTDAWLALQPVHASGALLFGLTALGASILHLGRPQYFFRGILGIRHSWLSREILAFGIFAKLAMAYFAAVFAAEWGYDFAQPLVVPLAFSVAVAGIGGVFCSVMIYAVTQRELWSFARSFVRFGLSTALLGVSAVWLSLLLWAVVSPNSTLGSILFAVGPRCTTAVLLLASTKLLWELSLFRHLLSSRLTSLKRSALLMKRQLSNITLARLALGFLGGVLMPAFLLAEGWAQTSEPSLSFFVVVSLLVLTTLAGELLERYLFFAAVAAPRMPGAIR